MKYSKQAFERDLSMLIIIARRYQVRDFIKKWSGRVKFDKKK